VGWGDGTANGAGAGGANTIRAYLAALFTPKRFVVNCGIGGEPPVEIADRFVAQPYIMRDAIHIIYFGRASYSELASDFTAQADRCWAARPNDRMLFMVPGPGANANEQTEDSAQITISNDARADLIASYPSNYIDQMQALWDAVDPGDDQVDLDAENIGYCPPKFLADDIHRNSAGQEVEAGAIHAAIAAKGW